MQPANLIAIRVNRKSITLKQLLHRLQVDAALSSIDRMIEDLTVEDWAETAGIAADSAGLQAAVNTFRRANGLYTAAQAGEWLGRRGMTLDDLAAMLRPQVLRKLLADHAVSGEEIRLHFLETAQQHDRCE
ncbi:MAG: hypothetical protein K0Q59_2489, partial [Paenibacillus sp.]|nr:hypothetical protein [Paenibacillus sp.]